MKSIVVWDVTPYSLVDVQRFGGSYCLHHQGLSVSRLFLAGYLLRLLFEPDDGGSMILQNVVELLPDYMASHPRRQSPL
jgi:hypothetical protein